MKDQSKATALSQEFANFLVDIETLQHAISEATGEELNRARAKLRERVAEAKVKATDISEGLSQRAHQAAERVNSTVHDEPWKAVGAGAAVGLVLGLLLARL